MDNHELLSQIANMMEQQTKEIKLTVEHHVTKRIDALFDGYKLTHEKQWELERKLEALERRLESIESQIA